MWDTTVCTFTDTNFARGRGISLIATPAVAEAIFEADVFLTATSETSAGPYSLQRLPGRGVGVVAEDAMTRGDVIMTAYPVVMMHEAIESMLPKDDVQELLNLAVGRLPERSRSMYMALHAHHTSADPAYERFKANGVRVFDFIAVTPELSVSARKYADEALAH